MNARLNQTVFSVQDSTDKSSFEAKAATDKAYRRFAADVEVEHQRLAQAGQFVAREAIFYYLVGKRAVDSRGSRESETKRAMGRRRVERERVNAGDTRNDSQGSRRTSARNDAQSREERLANAIL
jgi:hypothetical protein